MKLTADITIDTDLETVWAKSQEPDQHVLWDIRFTDIEYLPKDTLESPQRFRYSTRLGFGLAVSGWGESVGKPGKQTSALIFGSESKLSLIREGAGSWTYTPTSEGLRFRTVYDYKTRYGLLGRVVDRTLFRPLMQWAVRWSFDRLKRWVESGIHPATSMRIWLVKLIARVGLALVWIHEGLVPKILAVRESELDLVASSGLIIASPRTTLVILGAIEVAVGVWFLVGRAERATAALLAVAMVAIAALVVWVDPSAWSDPFGGISKNLGLLACAATVWMLAPLCPCARAARPAPLSKP